MAKPGKSSTPETTVLAKNRKATFDYHVVSRHEAGMVLMGSEVKSIRDGKISLTDAYGQFVRGELYLSGAHIAEYTQAHARNHEPLRRRKLLMHRREIDKLHDSVARDGLTLIPLSVYLKGGRIKVELGLCKGKKIHDKRASMKEREQKREVDRALRERN